MSGLVELVIESMRTEVARLTDLLAAHRAEFIDSFCEHLSDDRDAAQTCLNDFEAAVLADTKTQSLRHSEDGQ